MKLYEFTRQGKLHVWTAVGVVSAILTMMFFHSVESVSEKNGEAIPIESPSSPDQVLDRHLGWAEQASRSGIAVTVNGVREFFEGARNRTGLFAEAVLGFDSKWILASDFVSGNQDHVAFLNERFAEHIFAPEELEEFVEVCLAGYADYLGDVDSELLVRLQADLADLSSGRPGTEIDRAGMEQILATALQEATEAVEGDFRGMVGREVVSLVAGEILAAASVEMMTSAGILSAGATSGLATLGTGLLIGIATDFVVGEIYNELYDPAGELSRKLDAKLCELEELILAGTKEAPGLEQYLQRYASRRNESRDTALKSAFLVATPITSE